MKFKISVAIVTLALVAACGKDDSGLNKNKSTAAAPAPQSEDATVHQGPVPESGADDQAPVVHTKKKKKVVKKTPAQEPAKEEAPVATAVEPVAAVAAASPAPTAAPIAKDTVVGLGTTSQKPEQLLDRGYGFAIADARFCSVSGKFSNGSRCYAIYQDGSTKWADAGTHSAIEAFIVQLQAKADAEKAEKAEHKSEKKKGKFHWLKKLVP